jgi:hypothetical protein
MKSRILVSLTVLLCLFLPCSGASGIDEKILTPTSGKVMAGEDKEFNAGMAAWFGHRYEESEKTLREFSKKHPDSQIDVKAKVRLANIAGVIGTDSMYRAFRHRPLGTILVHTLHKWSLSPFATGTTA